jgi:hypothetical protein
MRDSYRQVLIVASAAALTDALLKMPEANVVTVEPPAPRFPAIERVPKFYSTKRPDRDKPWRRWPVRR